MTGSHPFPLTALAGGLLAVAAVAQDIDSWRLPVRGFAEYERTTTTWQVAPAQLARSGGLLRPIDTSSAWRVRSWRGPAVADGFQLLDFDDAEWHGVRLPLQTSRNDPDAPWPESEHVLDGRVVFEVPSRTKGAVLTIDHDDDVTVWLNGVQILVQPAAGRQERTELVFTDDLIDLFERRRNLLSIQVRNKDGGSRIGVEFVVSPRPFVAPENALARIERDRKQATQVQNGMFTAWRGPPVLGDGELDQGRQFVTTAPVDFRDLGAHVAFDLREAGGRGGPMEVFVPVSWKLGDLKLAGRAEARDASGRQRIVLAVEGVKPDARRYEKRYFEREILRWWEFTFDGELVVDRWIDPDRGVVTRLDSRLTGTLSRARGEEEVREFEVEFAETWTLKGVRESRDGKFQEDVANAIRTGAEFLRRFADDPETDRLKAGGDTRTYPSGRLGMVLLAMIHAGVSRDDEVLVRGLNALRARKLVDTYSTAHALMAIEAYHAPRGEYEDLRSGAIDRPRKRQLPDRDMALVREWTAILLDNMDTRVDSAYLARWSYVKEARYDHSVNQYGLLGLYSAHLCGAEISPQIWRAAAAHLVDSQQRPGKRLPLQLTTHRQFESMRAGGTTTTGTRPAAPAGWSYVEAETNGEPRPIYGSMTCAGLTGLTIALAGMRDTGLTRDKILGEANEAMRMGFAWLAQNFTVRWHPGPGLHASYYTHHFYYLYGLERACELSGITLLNGRDWYQEGALALLAHQNADGSWPGMTGGDYDASTYTAMAILFLKKASMPVYTNR